MQSPRQLNDVEISKVASLAEKISQEPHVADTTWRAEVNWTGGFRSEAKVRDFDPAKSDEPASARRHQHRAEPGGAGARRARQLPRRGIRRERHRRGDRDQADVHHGGGGISICTPFSGLKDGNAGFGDIKVSVDLDSDADAEALQALHKKVTSTSPVGHTLSRAVPLDIRLA